MTARPEAEVSPARWALSVLSLFCHRRCIILPQQLVQHRSVPRWLASLMQQQLQPLDMHLVLLTMRLFLMLCLRILRKHCH
jgi:hypothetical protein